MTETGAAHALVSLAGLIAAAQLAGLAAVRLHQPRFIGEIAAGVLVGPHVLGEWAPELSIALLGSRGSEVAVVLGFASWFGLLLLMFVSGSEVRRLLSPGQRRPTALILSVGTAIPFLLAFGAGWLLPLEDLRGSRGGEMAFCLVFAAASAVTSIPVISRIFHDLGLLHTRFAGLVLGAAMLEDLVLFGVIAGASALASAQSSTSAGDIATHTAATAGYFLVGLLVAPRLLRQLHEARWNLLAQHASVAYAVILMVAYTALATLPGVSIVFGGFLAGIGIVGGMDGPARPRFEDALSAIKRVGFGVFIPLYFLSVGARLELGAGLSLALVLAFLVGSSLLRGTFVWIAGRASAFTAIQSLDLAVAMNARGGPGIVLATIAFEAAIIAPAFFTALVLSAVITSQVAGWWLARAMGEPGRLLGEPIGAAAAACPPAQGTPKRPRQ